MIASAVLPLSAEDRRRFDRLDGIVTAGLKTHLEMAEALAEIKADKLYREDFGTFEQYCKQRHGLSQARAYQLLDARDVMAELRSSTIVEVLPSNECQLRPLAKLPEGKAPEVWQKVVEQSRETGKPITGQMVAKAASNQDHDHFDDQDRGGVCDQLDDQDRDEVHDYLDGPADHVSSADDTERKRSRSTTRGSKSRYEHFYSLIVSGSHSLYGALQQYGPESNHKWLTKLSQPERDDLLGAVKILEHDLARLRSHLKQMGLASEQRKSVPEDGLVDLRRRVSMLLDQKVGWECSRGRSKQAFAGIVDSGNSEEIADFIGHFRAVAQWCNCAADTLEEGTNPPANQEDKVCTANA